MTRLARNCRRTPALREVAACRSTRSTRCFTARRSPRTSCSSPYRRRGRDDHDRGLPRHPPHRAPQEAVQLLAHQELPWRARPLVKRRNRLTVPERVQCRTARCIVPLDEDEVRERVRRLREAGVEAVAVCLLSLVTSTPTTSGASRRSCSRSSRRRTSRSPTRCCRSIASTSASRRSALNAYIGPKVLATSTLRRGDAGRRRSHGHPADAVSGGMATVEAAVSGR